MAKCVVCGKEKPQLCRLCDSIWYCSSRCTQADLPIHSLLCSQLSRFPSCTRPNDQSFRAILFPVNEKKPELVWLHCEYSERNGPFWQQVPVISNLWGNVRLQPSSWVNVESQGENMEPSHTISIYQIKEYDLDLSQSNTSIANIISTISHQHYDFRGPVVACGRKAGVRDHDAWRDIELTDFYHVVSIFLRINASNQPRVNPRLPSSAIKITGVLINCIGDEKLKNAPRFEPVHIPADNPIFSRLPTCDIGQHIGISIIAHRLPRDENWGTLQPDVHYPSYNHEATALHICCTANNSCWGFASKGWWWDQGSVIIVRRDQRPLLPIHIKAMCRYAHQKVRPLLSRSIISLAGDRPLLSKDAVVRKISRASFLRYWRNMVEEMGEWTTPSPYDDVRDVEDVSTDPRLSGVDDDKFPWTGRELLVW
ncbi:hypothetical protein DM02DRAFT_729122 [Periconia macrospinosa]|uniref:MYND-type domain-containing protein n=1 Tax=Periconia macrospinosa TaxID=97972 RepID=A0A2V1DQT0_9PLEO|nr:hypothetical protein DM02DRAFT_729122 [Periconia macrospinosa]